jgi:hypothetical protein
MGGFDTCLELINECLRLRQAIEIHFQGINAHAPTMAGGFLRDINEHKYLHPTTRITPCAIGHKLATASGTGTQSKDCTAVTEEGLIMVN